MPTPLPIHALEVSPTMRLWLESLSPTSMLRFILHFNKSDDGSGIPSDDAIFICQDIFYILATDDNRFYVSPCYNDPTISTEEIAEQCRIAIADLNAGVPVELVIPKVKTPSYYGAYTTTCDEAVRLAISWLLLDVSELPKCYNPPIVKPR